MRALGEGRTGFVKSLKVLALQSKGSEIISGLMEEWAKRKAVEERKRIIEVMSYVWNNLDWIENIPKVEGYGSNPVEKTVDMPHNLITKKRDAYLFKEFLDIRNLSPLN